MAPKKDWEKYDKPLDDKAPEKIKGKERERVVKRRVVRGGRLKTRENANKSLPHPRTHAQSWTREILPC